MAFSNRSSVVTDGATAPRSTLALGTLRDEVAKAKHEADVAAAEQLARDDAAGSRTVYAQAWTPSTKQPTTQPRRQGQG